MDDFSGRAPNLVLRRILLGVLGVLAWLVASLRPNEGLVLLGMALAIVAGAAFLQVVPTDPAHAVPRAPLRAILRRLLALLGFLPVFAAIVIRSGIQIARLALSPTLDFWPGIVRVKGNLPNRTATSTFAMLITLTPGTLAMDYDEANDDLYVHWIDVARFTGDEEGLDRRVTSGMRPWVRRLFA